MASAAIAAALGLVPNALSGILNNNAQNRVGSNQVDLLNFFRQLSQGAIGEGGQYSQNWDPTRDMLLQLLQNPNREGSPTSTYSDLARQFQQLLTNTNFTPNTVSGTTQENINNINSTLGRSQGTYDTLSEIIGNQGVTGRGNEIMDLLLQNAQGNQNGLQGFIQERLGNRGQTAEDQTLIQRLVDVANAGGATGVTQGLQGAGSDLLSRLTGGGFANPLTSTLTNTGLNLLNNYGSTSAPNPFSSQLAQNGQQLFNTSLTPADTGNTEGLNQVRGNAQDLFSTLMSNGGAVNGYFDPTFASGLNLLNNANSIDPISQMLMGAIGGIGSYGGGGVGARPSPSTVESGRTDLTSYLQDRMRGIYDGSESPLLSMDRMQSMARDTAGNAQASLLYNAMQQAENRGAIPGSSLGGGGINRFLLENSNTIAREMAQAANNAALQRQQLGLQERGQADALGLGIAGAENQRYGANVSRANSIDNDATQAYLGELSAATSRGNAGLAAQTGLLQALASSGANRYAASVQGGTGLLNSVLTNSSNNFNTGTGNALEALLGAEGVAASRYGTAATARSNDLSTALQSILGAGTQFEQGRATDAERNNTLLQTVLPFLSNTNTNEVNQFGNIGGLATNLFGLASQDELGRLAAYAGIGNAAGDRTNTRVNQGLSGQELYNNTTRGYLTDATNLNNTNTSTLLNALGLRGTQQGQDLNGINLISQLQGNDFTRQRQGTQDQLSALLQSLGLQLPLMTQENSNLQAALSQLGGMAGNWLNAGMTAGMANPFGTQATPTTSPFSSLLQNAGQGLSQWVSSLLANQTPNAQTPPFSSSGQNYSWTNNIQFPTFTNPFGGGR